MVFGHPQLLNHSFQFTPVSTPGARNPLYLDQLVNGIDLREFDERFVVDRKELYLEWLLFAYNNTPGEYEFFNGYFTSLIGNKAVQSMIESGAGVSAIMRSWEKDVAEFKKIRRKYLLYRDFE